MGLGSMFKAASGDKSIEAEYSFTESQTEQLLLAEKQGVLNTECRRHREWGPTLMNICWNKEKSGESLDTVYRTAQYLSDNFDKSSDGTLYDDVDLLIPIYHAIEAGATPEKPARKSDGSIDRCMFIFKLKEAELIAKGSERMFCGRLCMNDVDFFGNSTIMSEGNERVKSIVDSLENWAANKKSPAAMFGSIDDPFSTVANRGWNMQSIVLTLDDMNIRGYQLIYAMDYVDGSIEKLFNLLDGDRSRELVDYINMRSAKDYAAGDRTRNMIAVTSGASYQHMGSLGFREPLELTFTPLNIEEFTSLSVEPLKVDYSNLDIKNKVDIAAATRIIESRGFKLIKSIVRDGQFKDRLKCLIFYNPEYKDYIIANGAKEEDITYSGVSLYIHRLIPPAERMSTFRWQGSSGGHKDQPGEYHEFTYHDGLFRVYNETLLYLPEQDFDWAKIGFDSYGIPIPKYFELSFVRDTELYQTLGNRLGIMLNNMGSYHMNNMINAMLLLQDEELLKSASPHYALYKDWFYKNWLYDQCGWLSESAEAAVKIASIVLTYLKVPDDVIAEMVLSANEFFIERDARFAKDGRNARDCENAKTFAKVKDKLTNADEDIDKIISVYNLPDPKTLPIKLSWL